MTVDGVKMVFQNTPDTEAPVEMNTYFPQFKAFWALRKHHRHHPQHLHAARRAGAQCAELVEADQRTRSTSSARKPK
jgi:alkyl sulfatase BDS1-like metallo-beta-lactamase superfamily hydrolase